MFFQHDLAEGDPLSMIRKQRSKDIAAQRNTLGPHRDDLLFTLDQHPFKQVASQGQRKTLLFSLKLAERALLEENLGIPPLLLLDDVFEKLDPDRIRSLLSEVVTQTTSQIFITDTDSKRLNEQLNPLSVDWKGLGIDRH
jgi:DNA replication and repair protein RecF